MAGQKPFKIMPINDELIFAKHKLIQLLPISIDLTEERLYAYPTLDYYKYLTVSNGQVFFRSNG